MLARSPVGYMYDSSRATSGRKGSVDQRKGPRMAWVSLITCTGNGATVVKVAEQRNLTEMLCSLTLPDRPYPLLDEYRAATQPKPLSLVGRLAGALL